MDRDISNSADIIDVRDIIERVKELSEEYASSGRVFRDYTNSELEAITHGSDEDAALRLVALREQETWTDAEAAEMEELNETGESRTLGELYEDDPKKVKAIADDDAHIMQEEAQELIELRDFLEKLRGNGGDEQFEGNWYPLILVRESYFETYAQDEAEELGLISNDVKWPYTCIDWEKAANELRHDYSVVEYGDETYYYR